MKVFYLNDEKIKVEVKTRKPCGEPWDWDYVDLLPQEGRVFDIWDAPDGSIPFIKRWGTGLIMISYVEASAVPQLESQLSRRDV